MRVVKREAAQLKEKLENGETVGNSAEQPEKPKKAKGKKDGKFIIARDGTS